MSPAVSQRSEGTDWRQDHLTEAVADVIDDLVPAEARPFVVDDYVCVVEIMGDDGVAAVLLAPEIGPRQLSMLARAVDHGARSARSAWRGTVLKRTTGLAVDSEEAVTYLLTDVRGFGTTPGASLPGIAE